MFEQWIKDKETHGQVTFSIEEVATGMDGKSAKQIRKALDRAVSRGRIVSVCRGFYVIIPVQYQLKRIVPPSYYIDEMMRYLKRAYYVCLLSAASMHGAGHQRAMQYQVMTVAPRLKASSKKSLIDWNYRTNIPGELLQTRNAEMGVVRYSCPELTAVDLVQYADHIGGYQRAATVLAELIEEVDIAKIEDVFPYTTTATIQRLGYLLEHVLEEKEKADALYELLKNHYPKRHAYAMSTAHPASEESVPNRWYIYMNIDIEIDEI